MRLGAASRSASSSVSAQIDDHRGHHQRGAEAL